MRREGAGGAGRRAAGARGLKACCGAACQQGGTGLLLLAEGNRISFRREGGDHEVADSSIQPDANLMFAVNLGEQFRERDRLGRWLLILLPLEAGFQPGFDRGEFVRLAHRTQA